MIVSVQWSASVGPPANAGVQDIPFRQSGSSSPHDLLGVLAATVVLLGVTAAVLWFLNRKGWLQRWVAPAAAKRGDVSLRVDHSVRLSRNTVVYKIVDGRDSHWIVESDRNIRVVEVDDHAGGRENEPG